MTVDAVHAMLDVQLISKRTCTAAIHQTNGQVTHPWLCHRTLSNIILFQTSMLPNLHIRLTAFAYVSLASFHVDEAMSISS